MFQLFDGIQGVITGTLRGIGDTRTPMIVEPARALAARLTDQLHAVLRLGWGVYGLWVGLSLGLIIVGVILLWVWTKKIR